MSAMEERARDLVARIPEGAVGVEIGVWRGQFAELLLRLSPSLTLAMVDRWNSTDHQPRHRRSQESLMEEAMERTEFARDRRRIIRAESVDAAGMIGDASLDFAFIDADHSYEGCAADIRAWLPKIKPGGWIGGHDYEPRFTKERGYGVCQAVDDAALRHGWALSFGPDTTWYATIPR